MIKTTEEIFGEVEELRKTAYFNRSNTFNDNANRTKQELKDYKEKKKWMPVEEIEEAIEKSTYEWRGSKYVDYHKLLKKLGMGGK